VGTRVRAALESALRDAVSTGRLRPGVRLPSSRALAADLGIARNTVAEAYSQLVAEGWLTAVQGSGTRVARRPEPTEPAALADGVVAAKALADRNSSAIDQLALAQFIVSGAYDRHIRRSRLIYRRRRDRLVAALRRHAPRVRISGIAAGLHALVELPGGVREDEVVAHAAERGLYLQGLGDYAHDAHTHPPALVVGYAKPPEHAFTGAVSRLTAVLRDATG